ncbi:YrbL family protein [Marinilabiliaceae bacterium ANBcel2]|nr:YrbL family protein [Marinilabiliaceae bacterium ANBcel2]
MQLKLKKRGTITLDKKISNGNFRDCYSIKEDSQICIKKIKSNIGFKQKLQLKLLRPQINHEELNLYNSLPNDIKHYFNPVIHAEKNILVSGRPVDYDGNYSKTLLQHKKVSNEHFWREVKRSASLLAKHKIWFFEIYKGGNVVVKKVSKDKFIPIFIDYKHIGWKSFPIQINLLLDSEKERKFFRIFNKTIKRYCKAPHLFDLPVNSKNIHQIVI